MCLQMELFQCVFCVCVSCLMNLTNLLRTSPDHISLINPLGRSRKKSLFYICMLIPPHNHNCSEIMMYLNCTLFIHPCVVSTHAHTHTYPLHLQLTKAINILQCLSLTAFIRYCITAVLQYNDCFCKLLECVGFSLFFS